MAGDGRLDTDRVITDRAPAIVAGAALAALAGAWIARRPALNLIRSWRARVAIEGGSMAPNLRAGDWLLVDPEAYRRRVPRAGELALVCDPRRPDRLLVKRVASVLSDGALEVVGDDPAASTDSRTFGAVDPASVAGRPWFRYWPPERIGRIR
jgi:nickel-type superoxide dismutase maturation protease